MNIPFADTSYWIALYSPSDTYHRHARRLRDDAVQNRTRIVTSQMVLIEFLDGFCRKEADTRLRTGATRFVRAILSNPMIEVVEQSSSQFFVILDLFERFEDKRWSPTDCSSFQLMWDRKLTAALTTDHHFEQAGFVALMKPTE